MSVAHKIGGGQAEGWSRSLGEYGTQQQAGYQGTTSDNSSICNKSSAVKLQSSTLIIQMCVGVLLIQTQRHTIVSILLLFILVF